MEAENIKDSGKHREEGGFASVTGFALLHCLNDMHATSLPAVIPMLVNSIGLNFTEAGILSGLFGLTHICGQPVSGYLADRQRKPYFAVWGPFISVIGASLLPLSPSFAAAFLIILFMATGTALFHPQGVGRAGSAANAGNLAFFISLFTAFGSFGSALSPIYIVFVVQHLGPGLTPLVIIPAFFICLYFWRRLPSKEPLKTSRTYDGARGFLKNIRDVLKKVWTVVFTVSIRDASYQSIRVFLPMLVILRGGTMGSGSVTLFAVTLAGTVAGVIGGKLADRLGDRKVLFFSIAVAPFFVLAGLLTTGFAGMALLTLGCALLQASGPITTAIAQKRCPESRSAASSLAMGVSWGIANLAATPVGVAADAFGLQPTLYFVALVPWIATALHIYIARHER